MVRSAQAEDPSGKTTVAEGLDHGPGATAHLHQQDRNGTTDGRRRWRIEQHATLDDSADDQRHADPSHQVRRRGHRLGGRALAWDSITRWDSARFLSEEAEPVPDDALPAFFSLQRDACDNRKA